MFSSFSMIWIFHLYHYYLLALNLEQSKRRTGFQKWISMFDKIWNFHSKHISSFCLCSPVVLGKSCLKVLKEPETLFLCQSSAAPDLIIFFHIEVVIDSTIVKKNQLEIWRKKSPYLYHLFSSTTIFVSRLRPWLMPTSKKVFRLTIKAMIGRAQTRVWNSW